MSYPRAPRTESYDNSKSPELTTFARSFCEWRRAGSCCRPAASAPLTVAASAPHPRQLPQILHTALRHYPCQLLTQHTVTQDT